MCEHEYLVRLENTIISRMNIFFMSAIEYSKVRFWKKKGKKAKPNNAKKGKKNIDFKLFPIHSTLIYYEKKCDNNIQWTAQINLLLRGFFYLQARRY